MKKTLFLVLFALLGLASAWASDFSAVAPTGQTLYYTITSSSSHTVSVVPPYSTGWSSSNTPTGSLTIPSTVTYGGTAYSVTAIGDYAFYYCSGLTSVTIPNSVTSIGDYAFYYCSGLTSVTIPNSVTSIGDRAFEYCSGLTSVTIGNSVTSIGSCAFAYCTSLISVTIPNSVTSIGSAFVGCSRLTHVAFNARNCNDFSNNGTFSGCTNISTFTLGDSVQRIPAYLCYGLAITSITIPNSVTSIGDYAFYQCSGLTSLTIPNSVTSIGIYAFADCTSLNHVTFNAQNCDDFERYSYSDPRLPFTGCTNISTFTLGDSVQRIPACLCYGLAITSITIPNSVTSIGYDAFYGCSGLTGSLTIPNSVTSIEGAAFYGCSELTGSLTIPNSVTSIGGAAFYGCSGLTGSLTIPNSVTSIEGYTFYGCSGLTGSLIISDSVASIGDGAFAGCGRLKYLSLGRDVYFIGYHAFYGCSSITEITSKATLAPTLGEDAFEGVWSGIPVNIPCGSLAPYQDRWSYFSNFVECGAEEGIDDVEVPAYEVSSEQGGIVVKAAAGERVRVFDIAGRLLYQGRIEEEPWHYRVEKSGVYLVQIADSPAQKVVVIE